MRRALEQSLALPNGLHAERVQWLHEGVERSTSGSHLLYWMQTAVRTKYNYALEYAVAAAKALALPLHVVYLLADRAALGHPPPALPMALGSDENARVLATERHAKFALEGLADAHRRLAARGLRLEVLRHPASSDSVPLRSQVAAAMAREAALVVTDCVYLRPWRDEMRAFVATATETDAPYGVVQVEGDVVVPSAVASTKEEYAARTLRPRISAHFSRYLVPLETVELAAASRSVQGPSLLDKLRAKADASEASPTGVSGVDPTESAVDPMDLERLDVSTSEAVTQTLATLDVDRSVRGVTALVGGEEQASAVTKTFLTTKLAQYARDRNEPSADACSGLSPYLRFGHISPVRVVLAAKKMRGSDVMEGRTSFLEELIVRRELSVNMVVYNQPHYDSIECLPNYARVTLADHAEDERPQLYSLEQVETGRTYDPSWNAAQLELAATGVMHGYMRMYWGKKLLEWTATPAQGFAIALHLNNKFGLDAADPNSYAGIAWVFGKHDQGWPERAVFGKIRYMNEAGLRRKFRMDAYIGKALAAAEAAGIEVDTLAEQAAALSQKTANKSKAVKNKAVKSKAERGREDADGAEQVKRMPRKKLCTTK